MHLFLIQYDMVHIVNTYLPMSSYCSEKKIILCGYKHRKARTWQEINIMTFSIYPQKKEKKKETNKDKKSKSIIIVHYHLTYFRRTNKLTPKEGWLNYQTKQCNISTRWDVQLSTSTCKIVLFLSTYRNIAYNKLSYKGYKTEQIRIKKTREKVTSWE